MSSYLNIDLPICPLSDGKFKIPETINRIWLDVGTSLNSPNGAQYLKRHEDGFVIGFECNPQMYFSIYSMYYINKNKWLVDKDHPSAKIESEKRIKNQKYSIFEDTEEFIKKEDYLNRYIFIPVAISNTEGIKTLYNNKHEGSSSLEKTWGGIDINNKTDVMAFKLRKFIEMIPERFTYIEHLKIDCEGHDLNVLKSCEDLIGRIAVITIEEKNARGYLLDTGIFEFLEEQKGGYTFINKKYKNLLGKLDYYIRV